ncbi:TetR/AcrR family transcriptional regulator [Sphingopyxis chilensis]|uniref:TetR/AcrR family transcriptional regulator n=1 Tax=Sphingopyxis chilensis TaxID=180400 RepID=UPI002DDDB09D|nr:TetR/AcrR family transcriptional regulator [Sphingopyxis chilensis]
MSAVEKTGDAVPVKRRRGRPPASADDLRVAHSAARDRICGAALTLFDRGGIDAISMREIAGVIGASPMMPYKYFPTKDHLLQELRTHAFLQFEAALRDAVADAGTGREKLERMLIAYLEFGLRERRSYRLMFDYWVYDSPSRMLEDFGDAIRRQSGAWNVVLEVVEAYFADTGEDDDPMTAAHLIWASLHGLVSLEASRKLVMGRDFRELMAPMVAAIMNGVASTDR